MLSKRAWDKAELDRGQDADAVDPDNPAGFDLARPGHAWAWAR